METVTRFLETFRNDGMVTFNTKATFVLFCFVWMKSLSETNYRTNPNKNFQRVLQVPLSSFHLFAEATFGHWPSIQTGSSRR